MRISSLFTQKHKIPWITLIVIFCCVLITSISVVSPVAYEKLAWSNHPEHFWQYISGAFLHGDSSGPAMAIAHLLVNFMLFVPYAIMAEKLIGSKSFGFVFLSTWLGISAIFQILVLITVPTGEIAYGAGLSGSAFAVTVVGAFILFRVFMIDKKQFFRQPLAYIFISGLISELILLSPDIAGVSSMIIHLAGLLIGIILTIIYKAKICDSIKALSECQQCIY